MNDGTLQDLRWDVRGFIDGAEVTFCGEIVGRRPTFAKAQALMARLRNAAHAADDLLTETLGRKA